ncbi:MAG: SusC/RagA family TonB-linked outer membrane protein [Weeksellaceae bacterium]
MKKLLCLPISLFAVYAFAQVDVKGKVVMGDSQEPVAYAEVTSVENPQETTMTDADGNFNLHLTADAGTLNILSMEGVSTSILYEGNDNLTITLDPTQFRLNDIVAIGYGNVDKADLSTAVGQVKNLETISDRPVTNLSEFLQGNIAGVTVLSQGGDPTASPEITIRGKGTFNTEPVLYVVDGVPYSGPAINPTDIESVSILKDAAAASIYGAQAAGGVIVINTKKGKSGKPQINLNVSTSFNEVNNLPTPLNAQQQADTYILAAQNAGEQPNEAHLASKNPWGQVTRTNWLEEIFRTGMMNRVSVDMSGATDNLNYFTSVEYLDKEGVLLGTDFKRLAVRSKGDIDITDNLKTGVNLYYSHSDAKGTNTNSGYSGTILNAMWMPSAAPVYDEKGNYHGTVPNELVDYAGAYGEVYNPVAQLLRPTVTSPLKNFNGTGYISYEIIDGLSAKSTIGYNTENNHYKRFIPRIPELGRTDPQNYLHESFSESSKWTWDNQLSYDQTFERHSINLTAIHSAQEEIYDYSYQQGRNFSSEEPFNQYMEAAGELYDTPVNTHDVIRFNSVIGRLMYDFGKKYYLTASIRRDETSKANPEGDFQTGIFPAFSGAWRISKEDFFNSSFINELKIRGSWGKLGNVYPLSAYPYDVPLRRGNVVLGADGTYDYQGVYAALQSNPNISWEKTTSYDIGLDAELFHRNLTFTFDYYQKITEDLILEGLPDHHIGLDASKVNGGEVKNTGFEFSVNYLGQTETFNYNIGANLNINNNELVNLDGYAFGDIDYIAHGNNVRGTLYPYQTGVGQSLYSYFLIPHMGLFQSQEDVNNHTDSNGNLIQPDAKAGDIKFKDVNGDGTIDNKDKVYKGSYNPDFTYAINLGFEYKGFDFKALVQGVSGVEVFNAFKYETYNASLNGFNLDSRVLDAWSPTNTGSHIPRISTKDDNQNFGKASDWYLEDGSYVRLKNVTIGYTLPKFSEWLNQARIYVSAENLFTITDYSGMDPEVGGIGLDNGQYPLSKVYSFGFNINF